MAFTQELPAGAAGRDVGKADPRPLLSWFSGLPEVPLIVPPRFRESAPLTDDPDRSDCEFPITSVEGLTFGLEYFDLRGWTSARAVTCIDLTIERPGYLRAFCNVRQSVRSFRLDRILATTCFATGRVDDGHRRMSLLLPYLMPEEPACGTFLAVQRATRSGVAALLFLAMRRGRLSIADRKVVLAYIAAETRRLSLDEASPKLVETWVDNLRPSRDMVLRGVAELVADRAALTNLLPRFLQVSRGSGWDAAAEDVLMRQFIAAVRQCYWDRPSSALLDFNGRR